MGYARNNYGLEQLLDRPIAYHRCFVTLGGSVNAALLLSQSVYWQMRTKHRDGYWYKSQADWTAETGLSRREQETARRVLRQRPWWHEVRRGIPARMWFKVDLGGLIDALSELPQNRHSSARRSRQQASVNVTDMSGPARQTNSETPPETNQKMPQRVVALTHLSSLRGQLKKGALT